MSRRREIQAVYKTVNSDTAGALDCILQAIEIAMEISKEKGANYNDKTNKH